MIACRCSVCGLKYTTTEQLKAHQKTHSRKRYACDYAMCGKIYKSSSSLRKHLKDHCDVAEPRIDCQICNGTFKSLSSFRSHMTYMHKKQAQNFKCSQCLTILPDSNAWQAHVDTVHPIRMKNMDNHQIHERGFCGKDLEGGLKLKVGSTTPNGTKYDCDSVVSPDDILLVKNEPMLDLVDVDAETSSLENIEIFDNTPSDSIDHCDAGDNSNNNGIDTDDEGDGSKYDPMPVAGVVSRTARKGKLEDATTAAINSKPIEKCDDLIPRVLNMVCGVCAPEHPFKKISELQEHYRNKHNFGKYVRVKCYCQRRILRTHTQVREHIQSHFYPNKFK